MASPVVTVFCCDTQIAASAIKSLSELYEVHAVLMKAPDDLLPASNDPVSSNGALASVSSTLKCLPGKLRVQALGYRDGEAVRKCIEGASAVVVLYETDLSKQDCYDVELSWGRYIASACERVGVHHIIYSTQLSVVNTTGVRARHMDAKAEVESCMKQLGLPVTSVIIPCTYQQFLQPPFRPTRIQPGCFALDIPMASIPLNLISADDVGPVLVSILAARERYCGKTVSLCAEKLNVREIAAVLSHVLEPVQFLDKQLTLEQYRQLPYPEINDFASMFDFFTRVDQRSSLDHTKELNPWVQSLGQWLMDNRDMVIKAMNYPEPERRDPWNV